MDIISYNTAAKAQKTIDTHEAVTTGNPHGVTKSEVGLGNVTNDAQLKQASNLSDLTNASTARNNLGVEIGVDVQGYDANIVSDGSYVHTDNNYTTTEKSKLAGIENNANNYVHPSTHPASMITTTDEFAYSNSSNVQDVLDDLDQAIANVNAKDPVITLTGDVTGSGTMTNLGNVSIIATVADDSHNHTIANVDGLQAALDSKLESETVTSISVVGNELKYIDEAGTTTTIDLTTYLDDTNLARITSGTYDSNTQSLVFTRDDDSTFSIDASMFFDDTNLVTSVAGRSGSVVLTKSDVGLSNVDNTSDATKNVLSATKLTTARTISLSGDATGSISFNGSANVTIPVVIADDSHNHTIANVDGLQTALNGKVDDSQVLTNVPAGAVFTDTVYTHPSYAGDDINLDTGALTGATVISDLDFNVTTDTLGHVTDANATYATRNITYSDVGAAAASHSHSYLPLSGGTLTGTIGVQGISNSIKVGDITADNYTEIKHTNADGYGFDFQHNNASVVLNQQGTTNEVVVLGDVDAGNTTTLFGVGHSTDGGANWTPKFNFRGDAELYIGSSAQNKVFHDNYHPNADKWTTARTISLAGDVTGSTSFDGSGNVSITATIADDSHNHTIANVDGLQTALDGKLSTTGKAADADKLDGLDSTYYRNASNLNAGTINDARLPDTISSSITGNAATATWADTVDVNGGNTSSSWYDVVWHSGDTVYSSTGVEIQGSTNSLRASNIEAKEKVKLGASQEANIEYNATSKSIDFNFA